MSNERTIESCYIIKVQNGHLDFIPRFAISMQERIPCISALLLRMVPQQAYLQTNGWARLRPHVLCVIFSNLIGPCYIQDSLHWKQVCSEDHFTTSCGI